jgi:predicted NBD/HSP70 family sugar kinase
MKYYVGLDVIHKRTSICVIDDEGTLVWRGEVDTHPEMIVSAFSRWANDLKGVSPVHRATDPK